MGRGGKVGSVPRAGVGGLTGGAVAAGVGLPTLLVALVRLVPLVTLVRAAGVGGEVSRTPFSSGHPQ